MYHDFNRKWRCIQSVSQNCWKRILSFLFSEPFGPPCCQNQGTRWDDNLGQGSAIYCPQPVFVRTHELTMGFTFLNGRIKSKQEYHFVLWENTRKPNFMHSSSFTGTRPRTVMYSLSLAAFLPQWQQSLWATKLEICPTWLLAGKACWPLL